MIIRFQARGILIGVDYNIEHIDCVRKCDRDKAKRLYGQLRRMASAAHRPNERMNLL